MIDHEPHLVSEKRLDLSQFTPNKQRFEEAYTSVHERDLFPYDDDDFLASRLRAESRLFRNSPDLQEEVKVALLATDDDAILEAVDDITAARRASTPEIKKPIAALLSYLSFAHDVSDYKTSLTGKDAPSDRVNAITILAGQQLAADIPEDKVTDALYSAHYLSTRMAQLYEKTHNHNFFFYEIKIKGVTTELQRRHDALRYLDAFSDTDPQPVTPEQLQKDSAYISELFHEIQSSRQYGVKMAYTPDERGGSLVFSPPYDIKDYTDETSPNLHPLTFDTPAAAEIVHSGKTHPKRLKLESTEHAADDELGAISLSLKELTPLTTFVLGPDGELYLDRRCTQPYAEIARSKGKYYAYRDLQATILSHYFDLTHASPATPSPKPSTPAPSAPSERTPLDSIEKLVVPRVQQISPPSEQVAETAPRSVRYHGVTWHVRDLPAGWHASPNAHKRAEKLGITLEPGQTVVKAHHRGSKLLGEVVGHQISRPQ